ncbi:RICIN domain-containing protein [Streptomyces sp. TRM64462]|uniref:RICIN domain-containing protein n=1 Tax=Streptomyces sp. TRM64462 TaxID=2741726 RepID=UPI00158606AB|nr:RICIN domain-containing protein [Streptomyces sp. TRM64462]
MALTTALAGAATLAPPAAVAAETKHTYVTAKLRLDAGTHFYSWKASCPAGTVMDLSPLSTGFKEKSSEIRLDATYKVGDRERVWTLSNPSLLNGGVAQMTYTCIGTPTEVQRQTFPDVQYDCEVNTTSCTTEVVSTKEQPGPEVVVEQAKNCNTNPDDRTQDIDITKTYSRAFSSQYAFMEGSQLAFTLGFQASGLTGNISYTLQRQETWSWSDTSTTFSSVAGKVPARHIGFVTFTPQMREVTTKNTLTYKVGVYDARPDGDQKTWVKTVVASTPKVRPDGSTDGQWGFHFRRMTAQEELNLCKGVALFGPTHNKTYVVTARQDLKALHVTGGQQFLSLPSVVGEVSELAQQRWVLTRTDLPDGNLFTYTLKNADTGKCLRLDDYAGSDPNSRQVYQVNCSTSDMWQQWRFRSIDNGWKQITSYANDNFMLTWEAPNAHCGTRGLGLGQVFGARFSPTSPLPTDCTFGLRQTLPAIT